MFFINTFDITLMYDYNIFEIAGITLLPLVSIPALSGYPNRLLTDTFIFPICQYLAILKPNLISIIYTPLIIIALSKKFIFQRKEKSITRGLPYSSITTAVALYRSLIMVPVVICILMCDFPFWVQRFGKTSSPTVEGGIGLMDTGVSSFVFNGGLMSSKITYSRFLNSSGIQVLLGFVRLAVVSICKLTVNPKEYGLHLNFYFILAIINMLFILVNSSYNLLLGISLLIFHEFFASRLASYILNDDRSSWVLQNKEGLFSIMPLLGVFLIANKFGSILFSTTPSFEKYSYCLLFFFSVCLAYYGSTFIGPSSRILCNLRFSTLNTAFNVLTILLCLFISWAFSSSLSQFRLVRLISYNMLAIFLCSNLIVLVLKLLFDLENFPFMIGNIMNIFYLIFVFAIFPSLIGERKRRQTLKENVNQSKSKV